MNIPNLDTIYKTLLKAGEIKQCPWPRVVGMKRISFTEHPAAVGETYVEHLRTASSFGISMLVGGAACLVHGLLPFLFTRTGSKTVARLHDRMVTNRVQSGRAGMSGGVRRT